MLGSQEQNNREATTYPRKEKQKIVNQPENKITQQEREVQVALGGIRLMGQTQTDKGRAEVKPGSFSWPFLFQL